jgi:hypothetical protein
LAAAAGLLLPPPAEALEELPLELHPLTKAMASSPDTTSVAET